MQGNAQYGKIQKNQYMDYKDGFNYSFKTSTLSGGILTVMHDGSSKQA
jgi:hypothetical protein